MLSNITVLKLHDSTQGGLKMAKNGQPTDALALANDAMSQR